ncbi:MAG: hypothetical protein K8F25_16995, partial [Fimbriimonadaceae bacterium]|nr:hypothetical protein [Alphaproteobacteria bacterium]
LTAGAESTKGVWIVKPSDLETLALRTPLGLSGQYDLDIELVAANGNTMDRKSFRVVLSSEAPSTVAVNAASAPESGQQAAAQNETQTANAAVPSANAYISDRAYNEALAASGLSLFDFQERAKVNGLMIARGDSFMANGDISSARLLFERAGKDGSAVGATLAAMTYDPIFLKENGNHSMRPDAGKAQVWYAKAIALGSDEAKSRRAALDTFLASN